MSRVQDSKGVFKKKTTEVYSSEIEELYNGKIEVTGDYIDCSKAIAHRCREHGVEFTITPTSALRGNKQICPRCKGQEQHARQRKPVKVFKQELKEKHRGTIVARGAYVNTHTKIDFECKKCETLFCAEPNAVLRISGCPGCRTPKGELDIKNLLEDTGIAYQKQKTFKGCKDVRLLSFDFYLPDYNLLIEYDGKQHFEPIKFFGGETEYIKQVRRDAIKNNYAKENNINIIRIPYTVTGRRLEQTILDELKQLRSKAEGLEPNIETMI